MASKCVSKGGPLIGTGAKIGRLDLIEECNKNDVNNINKQVPYRSWCLAVILCAVVCITIVSGTVWACSIAGIGAGGAHHHALLKNNNAVLNEDMMSRLLAIRNPDSAPQKQTSKEINYTKDHVNIKITTSRPTPTENENNSNNLANGEYKLDIAGKTENRKNHSEVATNRAIKENNDSRFFYLQNIIDKTQISSPDDAPTTNLASITSPIEVNTSPVHVNETNHSINETEGLISVDIRGHQIVSGISKKLKEISGHLLPSKDLFYTEESNYGPDEYFYSELDASSYYDSSYWEGPNTWTGYILEKIQEVHDWITTDIVDGKKKYTTSAIPQILRALNYSIVQGDATILILKLKDMYYGLNSNRSSYDSTQSRQILTNTTHPASFALLTLDLLLLRNLQLINWDNEETATNEVLKDPEIFAMNALFLEPDDVKKIYTQLQKAQVRMWSDPDRNQFKSADLVDVLPIDLDKGELTSGFYSTSTVARDIIDFTFSTVRAAINLGRAFRHARSQNKKTIETKTLHEKKIAPSQVSEETMMEDEDRVTELDCLWTLYCRNLDKASKSSGIYGFLAKLNSLGLRLIIGELRLERALDTLLEETLKGAKPLQCDSVFPKCSKKNAPKIVLEGIVGKTSAVKSISQNLRRSRH